jgi:hypothetical protein
MGRADHRNAVAPGVHIVAGLVMLNPARIAAIWICGLFFSGAVGAAIGYRLSGYGGDFFGMLAGVSAFVCARLWYSEARGH